MTGSHAWKFFRTGGFDQVRLDTGADLLALRDLDQKLWVALSCPVKGIDFPADTLQMLDDDDDGHVRAAELLAAIDFVGACLREPDLLLQGNDNLPLAAIDSQTETGARVLAAARRILTSLGRGNATSIALADVADRGLIFGQTRFNGDGIIAADAAESPDLQALITEIATLYGSREDRSGQPGIDLDTSTRFFDDVTAALAWHAARPPVTALTASEDGAEIDALAALAAVRDKIDDYFTRCRLAAFDAGAEAAMNGSAEEFLALGRSSLAAPSEAMTALPLARAAAGRPLPLETGLNPAWAGAMGEFARRVVTPTLGHRDSLGEAEWRDLAGRFATLSAWLAERPATPVAQFASERLQALANGGARAELETLLARDTALTDEFAAVDEVDRLLHYLRDLHRFANNFVAFRDFYTAPGPGQVRVPAIFQAGILYLDGRSCSLCVAVNDPGKHAALASLSRLYLAYCECSRGTEKMTIAAAVTAGDADQIMVGRNGVFYDRQGRDWDATVVKLIDHSISLRQAFWSPYRKIARMVSEQIHKFAAARQQAVEAQAGANIAAGARKVESSATTPPPPVKPPAAGAPPAAPPPPFDVGKFAGIFAAIGLALGAIGTAIASVLTGFINLHWWQMPLAIGGVMLLVSGPSMLITWFKLRARNLGPVLDANGWAVNSRALINIPFGTSLTQLAKLPPGAERALVDPYAEKRHPWGWYVVLVVALLALLVWMVRGLGA